MIQEIKYTGFTASPSDYEAPDGDLAAVIGLVPDEGNLKAVIPPASIFTLSQGKVIFVHESVSFSPGKHYIILDGENNKVTWRTKDGSASGDIHTFRKPILSINAIGNTIIIITSDGMHYFLWKPSENNYLNLGNHLPECPISFGLQGEMVRSDSFDISFDDIHYSHINDEFSDSNKIRITSQVLAKVNKFIEDKSTNNGRFIYPFLVRCAYRLYDGSLTMHSAPVLMVASSDLAPQVFYDSLTLYGSTYYIGAKLRIVSMLHQLDYACFKNSSIDELKNWKDIISSVDVFISKPIYTYDQNGECTKFVLVDESDCYSICKHINQAVSAVQYPLRYQRHDFRHLYAFTFDPEEKKYPTGRLMLPQRLMEDVRENIRSCSQFYFLQSINIDKLTTERTIIPIEKNYLQSLVAREVMTDDYDSHDTLLPKYTYGYNSRLNIANLQKILFNGYNAVSVLSHTDGYSVDGNLSSLLDRTCRIIVYVFIRQDGREIVVKSDSGVYGVNTPTLFFYYPNQNAYKAVIEVADVFSKFYEIPLEPHSMLNGAFYFGGWETPQTEYSGSPKVSSLAERTINLPNKIYTSEVNNPFHFPVLGINTVGTGSIIGISTAAKALSEGQFGQFPLYAFTSEGVWALEIAKNGGYTAVQPITRDVCINADSITQLDSSVLFATNRGIMLLSGSKSICISDSLDYQQVFSLSSLPKIDDLISMAGFSQQAFNYVPFRSFLQGCRMIYAYTPQRVIVYNPSYTYAYIYSLKTSTWGMMQSTIIDNVPSYPEALAMLSDGSLVDFSEEEATVPSASPLGSGSVPVAEAAGPGSAPVPDAFASVSSPVPASEAAGLSAEEPSLSGIKGVLITRPLKLNAPDTLKTVDTIIQRGNFKRGHIKSILYGSRDLINWYLVWTSADHYLRGFRGTAYKYFRIALICDLLPEESINGATFKFTPRLLNQPR